MATENNPNPNQTNRPTDNQFYQTDQTSPCLDQLE